MMKWQCERSYFMMMLCCLILYLQGLIQMASISNFLVDFQMNVIYLLRPGFSSSGVCPSWHMLIDRRMRQFSWNILIQANRVYSLKSHRETHCLKQIIFEFKYFDEFSRVDNEISFYHFRLLYSFLKIPGVTFKESKGNKNLTSG